MTPDSDPFPWWTALAACAATFAACWLLARRAPRLGWVDAGDGGRKTQRVPLPVVGGMSIAIGLACAGLLAGSSPISGAGLDRFVSDLWYERLPEGWCSLGAWPALGGPWITGGLAAAFLLGLVDDLRPGGLGPLAKLAGQSAAGAVLAAPLIASGDPTGYLLVAGAVVAMNAMNTFDNADGATSGLSLLALAPVQPLAAAALLGFLPFNLRREDGRALVGHLPHSILGDSGSHLLGMLVLVTPLAWPVLVLPLLDLARVCCERLADGQAPWVGDRRHLAHRFERRGAAPAAVALALVLVAAPSAILVHAVPGVVSFELVLTGLAATGLLFALAVLTSRPERARTAPVRLGLEA